MIRTLYKIGKLLKQKKEYAHYFEPWNNPFPGKEEKGRVIVFDILDGTLNTKPVIESFKTDWSKYLYREASANGTNLVPTFLYPVGKEQEEIIAKRLNKIKASLKNYGHTFMQAEEVDSLFEPLLQLELNPDHSYLLTFTINGNYFGDFDNYRKLFNDDAYNKYYQKNYGTALGKNQICSVTYELCEEVWGFVDTLGFTVNEEAFLRNGFDKSKAYNMFPVSPDAVKLLEGTMKFMTEKASKNFYGLKYFIVPHFIKTAGNDSLIEEALNEFINITINPLTSKYKSIIGAEDYLGEIIEDEKLTRHNIYYDLFFYGINNAQFLIKLHLSDVLPSRLKLIHTLKEQIESRYSVITNIVLKDKVEILTQNIINFKQIKDYFSKKVKTDTVFHPMFFKIIEAVFYGNKLQEGLILNAFFEKIQSEYKNRSEKGKEFDYVNSTKETFVLYNFFLSLNLFNNKTTMETNDLNTPVALTPDSFVEQHPAFFDSEYKKGVFWLGCLTQILMKKQYDKLKNDPFSKNLNSLSLDKVEIAKLFPKVINKLREYDYRLPDLEGKIAKALVNSCNLNRTDISYTFTLGMIMQREFSNAYYAQLNKEQTDNQ